MIEIVPTTLREANAYVLARHRHHGESRGCIFCVAAAVAGGGIVGVAIVGRPVARLAQDGFTAEVLRLCTDGTRNACSKLYAACWRAARAIGYRKLITYTLASEGGTSLRAAGWALRRLRRWRFVVAPGSPARRYAPDPRKTAMGSRRLTP